MAMPVVGFDLDLTLLDARTGIAATYRELIAHTGVHVDVDTVIARLGRPLAQELAHWFPPGQVDAAVHTFRRLYPGHALATGQPMPGAAAAVAAVRDAGGQVVVITSKLGSFARDHLDRLAITVDEVVGDRFGDGKVAAIRDHRVGTYVGDHVADVAAARTGGATAVGVATGPHPADDLAAAGADVVLADLTGFPAWWEAHRAGAPIAGDMPTGTG